MTIENVLASVAVLLLEKIHSPDHFSIRFFDRVPVSPLQRCLPLGAARRCCPAPRRPRTGLRTPTAMRFLWQLGTRLSFGS